MSMFLYIDLNTLGQIYLVLFNEKGKIFSKKTPGKSRDLVAQFDNFLREHNLKKTAIKGIAVGQGKGSFTSSRIAAVFANMLKFIFKIPVIGVSAGNENWSMISKKLSNAGYEYLLPTYSGKPNIG